jgi:hypothetical protein
VHEPLACEVTEGLATHISHNRFGGAEQLGPLDGEILVDLVFPEPIASNPIEVSR